MPTTTNNADSERTETDLPASVIFDVLADQRRRFALHYLSKKVGAIDVGDLADQIALWEGDHSRDRYERICTSLAHMHLPKLRDADLVTYDPERACVELLEAAGSITPYLDLAAPTDFRTD